PLVDVGRLAGADERAAAGGFELVIRGGDLPGVVAQREPWRMSGRLGRDELTAATAEFGLSLTLTDTRPEVVRHDGDGWLDLGPAGSSYYYSRPRMDAAGTVQLGGEELRVAGTSWFDHQWGDFIAVGAGGWDWFAVNLDDGTDVMLALVRWTDGTYPLVFGTLVEGSGEVVHLDRDDFTVAVTAEWTSPHTAITYPAGWRIELPDHDLLIELAPTVGAQELDTRATSGAIYWEGSQQVAATRAGSPLGGEAYVELTGYRPTDAASPAP
ncbi:MAG: carotenoid 1,2-hydratase, partial [Chloroflexota bacterium]|nr:carotenoid 1,2-hydratase [Chloroflexota bacterium]